MHDTATLLSLHAGQAGKLIFNITAPEGVETTLQGAVMVAGHAVPMVATPAGELLVPALPAGCYRFECRACGATVLCGELDVHPSPLAGTPGQTSWSVAADLTQPLQAVAVTFLGGPQGPRGEQGERGEKGERGEQGERAALGAGDTRTLQDWGLYTVELTAAETDLTGLSVAPTATARLLLYPQAEGCTAVFPPAWVFLTPLPQVAEPNTLYCVTVFADAHGYTVANFAFNAAVAVA